MLTIQEPVNQMTDFARLAEYMPRWQDIPLYRDALVAGDFSLLPIIGKHELRQDFPRNFLRAGQNLETLLEAKAVEMEHSSGTSEDRTAVLFDPGWWDRQEATVLRINSLVAGVLAEYPEARRVAIVPPVCNGLVCFSNYNSLSERTVGRTIYANQARIPFLITEAELARMARETADWAPQFLDVDPVQGAWFALYCERNKIRFPSLRFILASYEFVSVVHRRILERVFGVPVFNLYGSTETGHLLMENTRGEMKACHEVVFYEVLTPDDRGIGELVVTTLTNRAMPLLRYRVGDLVERRGRSPGVNWRVHGRSRDALSRSDGQRVTTWEVDQCFADVSGIAHYQLRQTGEGGLDLQWIADGSGPSPAELTGMCSRLEALLQPASPVSMGQVTMLPPTPSGKFRLTCRA
jgi:phenylacetate-CoA ligase